MGHLNAERLGLFTVDTPVAGWPEIMSIGPNMQVAKRPPPRPARLPGGRVAIRGRLVSLPPLPTPPTTEDPKTPNAQS